MPEYVTSTLLKLQLGGMTDTARDDLIDEAILAASRKIEKHCGRVFYLEAAPGSARVFDPRDRVYLDGSLLVDDMGVAPTLVELGSWTGSSFTYETVTGYELGPLNSLVKGMPYTSLNILQGFSYTDFTRIRITARWGFPAVPDEITEAALILATRYYKRANSPEGVLGNSEWGTVRLSKYDPDVYDLLAPYVIHEAV